MRVVVVLLLFAGAIAISCKNEPYEKAELAVATLVNHAPKDSSGSVSYGYRGNHLYTFRSVKGSLVLTSIKFNYIGDQLINAIIDSTTTVTATDTVTSFKIDTFYGYGTSTVIDSTKLYVDTTAVVSLFSVRTITYDENGNPILVNQKLYPSTGMTEQKAELTWDGGNVVRLVTTNVTTGTVRDLSIGYDGKNGVYKFAADYIFTLSLQKLYWLSGNNPIIYNDGTGDKKYTFSYNKFDYPTTFKSEVNTQFGVTYINR
ncbi:MAG: hypothetical protein WDO15_05520 [Bacteroidota bacterium]